MTAFTFVPIGYLHSCFPEKFGIPRQAGLVPDAQAILEIIAPYARPEAFKGLENFSHIWIVFVFHQCQRSAWKATVRPPRLGGNQRIGVFATRSGFRPNPIGQSVVKLVGVENSKGKLWLHLKGVDLLDGTPVLDLKPYLPYADTIADARAGYADEPPLCKLRVRFSDAAAHTCRCLEKQGYARLEQLITAILAQDPRPAYLHGSMQRLFGMCLWDLNVKFSANKEAIVVEAIERVAAA